MRIDKRLAGSLGLALVLMAAVGLVPVGEAGDNLCIPLEVITIKAPEGIAAQRGDVDFPHGRHFGYSCTACHHKWTGTSQNLNCTTSGCHDLAAAPEKGSGTPAHRHFKQAYHAACIGCHKKIKVANRAAEMAKTVATVQQAGGPTGCVGCHAR